MARMVRDENALKMQHHRPGLLATYTQQMCWTNWPWEPYRRQMGSRRKSW